MHERGYERDLKFDLFATQCGRSGQGLNVIEAVVGCSAASTKRRRSRDRCPALFHHSMAGFLPRRLSEMVRQQLGLGLSRIGELVSQDFADKSVQDLAPALEQILVGSVLNKRVLEAICGFWGYALHQKNVRFGEPFKSRLECCVVHFGNSANKRVREAPADHCADLCHLARRTELVELRGQQLL